MTQFMHIMEKKSRHPGNWLSTTGSKQNAKRKKNDAKMLKLAQNQRKKRRKNLFRKSSCHRF